MCMGCNNWLGTPALKGSTTKMSQSQFRRCCNTLNVICTSTSKCEEITSPVCNCTTMSGLKLAHCEWDLISNHLLFISWTNLLCMTPKMRICGDAGEFQRRDNIHLCVLLVHQFIRPSERKSFLHRRKRREEKRREEESECLHCGRSFP